MNYHIKKMKDPTVHEKLLNITCIKENAVGILTRVALNL